MLHASLMWSNTTTYFSRSIPNSISHSCRKWERQRWPIPMTPNIGQKNLLSMYANKTGESTKISNIQESIHKLNSFLDLVARLYVFVWENENGSVDPFQWPRRTRKTYCKAGESLEWGFSTYAWARVICFWYGGNENDSVDPYQWHRT